MTIDYSTRNERQAWEIYIVPLYSPYFQGAEILLQQGGLNCRTAATREIYIVILDISLASRVSIAYCIKEGRTLINVFVTPAYRSRANAFLAYMADKEIHGRLLRELVPVRDRISGTKSAQFHMSQDGTSRYCNPAEYRQACRGCGKSGAVDRVKACARCGKVFYCGKECQVADWGRHKPECKQAGRK